MSDHHSVISRSFEGCPLFDVEARHDGATTVKVHGELDLSTGRALLDRLPAVLPHEAALLVDLSEARFVDCSGARLVFQAIQRVRAAGGDVAICSVRPLARAVLEAFGLEDSPVSSPGSWHGSLG